MDNCTSAKLLRIECKVHDMDNLKGQYELEITTPKVEDRMRQGFEAMKELTGRVLWKDVVFWIEWPHLYPDSAPLRVSALATSSNSSLDLADVSDALIVFSEACVGSNTGYAADVLAYGVELISALPPSSPPGGDDALSLHVLKYNHLLLGNEHKKEKVMMSIAKKSLLGGVCYGTPGLIVLLGADDGTAASFLDDCRAAGKRGEVVFQGNLDGAVLQGTGSRWPAADVTARKGFVVLTAQEVQACMGGLQAFKQHVLQIS
mmetsp:Transcript_11493/g.18761  ORF Transcript_11493/g.18761 Transcript_11493/m.18761 type:complete len:261 (+) Transcript_11493:132-914(+)